MDRLTAEIIKNQMIGQTSGHMADIPNSPAVFLIFEIFYRISRTESGKMYSREDAFKLFISEFNSALQEK